MSKTDRLRWQETSRQQHGPCNKCCEQRALDPAADDLADAAEAILADPRGGIFTIILASVWLIASALFTVASQTKER